MRTPPTLAIAGRVYINVSKIILRDLSFLKSKRSFKSLRDLIAVAALTPTIPTVY
jgi:hypothetical protein